jgi:hypothetical protein
MYKSILPESQPGKLGLVEPNMQQKKLNSKTELPELLHLDY